MKYYLKLALETTGICIGSIVCAIAFGGCNDMPAKHIERSPHIFLIILDTNTATVGR